MIAKIDLLFPKTSRLAAVADCLHRLGYRTARGTASLKRHDNALISALLRQMPTMVPDVWCRYSSCTGRREKRMRASRGSFVVRFCVFRSV